MKFVDKVVTEIPLESLWTIEGEMSAHRRAYLDSNAITLLLKNSAIQFVIADVGHKLNWVDVDDTFHFWKTEVKQHLANDINNIYLDKFPDDYAYIASEWTGEFKTPIVLLEKIH